MSESGSPGIDSMLSPGVMPEVDLTIDYTSVIPRQSISNSPSATRQQMGNASELPRSVSTNPLPGLHVFQVDDEHFFARWKYHSSHKEEWSYPIANEWLHGVLSKLTYGRVAYYEAIFLCKQVIHLYYDTSLTESNVLHNRQEDIDLIIYICQNFDTKTVSTRFIAEGTPVTNLQHRPMGFDLVRAHGVRSCEFTQWENWMSGLHHGLHRLLGFHLVIAEFGLHPFTWPSNDDDAERAQFFKSRFGHDAATNRLF